MIAVGLHSRPQGQCGQAIMELLITLVALTVVSAATIQFCLIGDAAIRNQHEARELAERDARSGVLPGVNETIGKWEAGPDGLRFTVDDSTTEAAVPNLLWHEAQLITPYSITNVTGTGLNDTMGPYIFPGSIGTTAGLHEADVVATVSLEAALRRLLFMQRETVVVTNRAYMPSFIVESAE